MAKIATLGTRIRARVYAHLTLRYVGAGRKPKADDRAIRRKRRYVTQTRRVCVPDPKGIRLRSVK